MTLLRTLTIALSLTLFGCGGEPPQGAALSAADPAAPVAPNRSAVVPQVPTITKPLPLPPKPAEPKPPPSPRSVSQLVGGRYSPGELAQWAAHPGLTPNLRLTALRRLERDDPQQAVTVALDLVRSRDTKLRLLRLNAVAVLARSTDRRAPPALAKLDPQLRRMADAIGRPQ